MDLHKLKKKDNQTSSLEISPLLSQNSFLAHILHIYYAGYWDNQINFHGRCTGITQGGSLAIGITTTVGAPAPGAPP